MTTRPNDKVDNIVIEITAKDLSKLPQGLTKREYFAALALQGILANSGIHDMIKIKAISAGDVLDFHTEMAVDHADSLIEALNA